MLISTFEYYQHNFGIFTDATSLIFIFCAALFREKLEEEGIHIRLVGYLMCNNNRV